MTIPKITIEQFRAASPAKDDLLEIFNNRIDKANAEQQESEYITAEQARELGAGNAEFFGNDTQSWYECEAGCKYFSEIYNKPVKYRAIKQAQPEPVDQHAKLRAEYAKQATEIDELKAKLAEVMPIAKFGAAILQSDVHNYYNVSIIASKFSLLQTGEFDYEIPSDIEATIEQLLKD